jgi:hypothetical protein
MRQGRAKLSKAVGITEQGVRPQALIKAFSLVEGRKGATIGTLAAKPIRAIDDVESPVAGVVRITGVEGETYDVGDPIGEIET